MQSIDYISFLWWLGMFLYGMNVFEQAIHNGSGQKMKELIHKWTKWWIKSILTWVTVTTILQSSALVSFIILWFVWVGMITLSNGIAGIIWANVGTVLWNWVIVFFGFKLDMSSIVLPIIWFGSLWFMFIKETSKWRNAALFLVWFGMLLLWLEYMKGSVTTFAGAFNFSQYTHLPLIIFVIIWCVVTMIMQSSSAMMAIILSAMATWGLDLTMAAWLVLWANIGSTFPVLLASINGKTVQKQIALSHFFYNLTIVTLWYIFCYYLVDIVENLLWDWYDPVIAISLFNTIFNISGAILFTPLIWLFTRFIERVVPDRTYNHELSIEKLSSWAPIEASIVSLRTDAIYLLKKVFDLNIYLFGVDSKYILLDEVEDKQSDHNISSYTDQYDYIKQIEDKLYKYILSLDQTNIDSRMSDKIEDIHKWINNAVYTSKFLKDIASNMRDIMDTKNPVVRDYFQRNQTTIVKIYEMLGDMIKDGVSEGEMKQFNNILKEYSEWDARFITEMSDNKILETIADLELSSLRNTHRYFCLSMQHLLTTINYLLLVPKQRIDVDKYDDGIL